MVCVHTSVSVQAKGVILAMRKSIVLFQINRGIKVARTGRQNLNHGVTETQRKVLKNSVYSVFPWFKIG
jgi:hypothetical protein